MTNSFVEVLCAKGPSDELGDAAKLYDWLIGRWKTDVIDYDKGGSKTINEGEWHFSWALAGRAIQDVFIVPEGGRYGTTLRTYDPKIDAWHIQWTNPVKNVRCSLVGRREGSQIVQIGRDSDGTLLRWNFSEITPNSFHWTGERSSDDGKTWLLQTEFIAKMQPPSRPETDPES